MTTAPGYATRVAAAGTCCVVAALSYSGAVTVVALLAFVLPAIVLVTAVTASVARLSPRLAFVAGLAAALGVAELVNLVSGTANGPAARSTFAATTCAVLAVAAVLGPAPALFLVAVLGVVVGALGLGAGAEVAPVAVATAVVTVIALGVVEAQDRRWTRRPSQLTTAVGLALVVGVLVAIVTVQADRRLPGEPDVLTPGAVQPTIRPPQLLGDPDPRPTATPTPSVEPTPGADAGARTSSGPSVPLRTIWLAVAMVVLTLLLCLVLRMVWVTLAWRLLRRRLRRGSMNAQVAGAWVWSTRRLRAAGWGMPSSLSPDAVAAGEGILETPRAVRSALRQVARSTVDAVFAPQAGEHSPEIAWSAADKVGRGAVRALPLARRLGFVLRPITSVPSHPPAPSPATPEENRS